MFFDVHNHLGVELGAYLRNEFPYGQAVPHLLDEAERWGVTHWIVFPMVSYLGLDLQALREGRVQPGGLEVVPYAWENRRLCEEVYGLFASATQGFLPFPMFDPSREVAAQVRALRELKNDYRIYGLKVQATIIQSPITALNDEGAAFLELAREWDVPVLIHSSVLPTDIWSQAKDILDIAEKWPDVRFNVAHSCRFDKPCLDRLDQMDNCWFDVSAHGIHCDLAVDESPVVAPPSRRFPSDYSRPEVVLADLAAAYPNSILWGSDSPYYSYAARAGDGYLSLFSSFARETSYALALPEELKILATEQNPLAWLGRKEHELV